MSRPTHIAAGHRPAFRAVAPRAMLVVAILVAGLSLAGASRAERLSALARPLAGQGALEDAGAGVALALPLDRAVPWRLFTLAAPWRVVIDFDSVDWRGFNPAGFDRATHVEALRVGAFRDGWTRMVLQLDAPMAVGAARLETSGDGPAVLRLDLVPTDAASFARTAGAPPETRAGLPDPAMIPAVPLTRQDGTRPLMVVLDPGHGGVDPGAQRDGVVEADLTLTFALELKEVLVRAGMEVLLTRSDGSFVPLEARVSIARAARADLFLSLHADTSEGNARGASVYTMAARATDAAARKLAERHDRADLLAGVDLGGQDDVVSNVLMDLAWQETAPRSERLGDDLVEGLRASVGKLHGRPRQRADFSVLKAPDIPSALIELGYMSSAADLARLTDPDWRARAAAGIRDALLVWARDDAAEARLIRK